MWPKSLEDIEKIIDESSRKLVEKKDEQKKFEYYVTEFEKIISKLKKESLDIRSSITMYLLDAIMQLLPPAELAPLFIMAFAELADTLKMHKRLAMRLAPIVAKRAEKLEEMK